MNIKRQILAGENVILDFKKTITSFEKISKTLVAFSNNKGGRLLIGVEDDGKIKGVKSEEEERYMITRAAHFFCRPQIEPIFTDVTVDDKTVVVVDIPESDTKPHYALGEDNKWWVYVRIKDKSVLASPIIVEVLKKETKGENVVLQYTPKEQALLAFLDKNESISLEAYAKLIRVPRKLASRILVNMILMGIIKAHTTEKSEIYRAV
jgi:predicted HTH transcriptional regulator